MILEISDGESGIKDYLVNGIKKDRTTSRDELDERVTLKGDLDVTDSIIQTLNNKVNYKHITISWKEDNVSIEDMEKAVDSFQNFMMSAYKLEEYNIYAEGHIPKLKSYKTKNGEVVIRKPHLHIIVANLNLISNLQLNPLGHVKSNIPFINAWQEKNNLEMGFASPKENRRNSLNLNSEIISRYKGDLFETATVLKLEILEEILENDITNYTDFENELKKIGDVKVRNRGKINEYLNLKVPHRIKGVNLKEYCFSKEFIELPKEQKIEFLEKDQEEKYIEKEKPKSSKKEYDDLLKEWYLKKALETKYIKKNGNFYKNEYKKYSESQKLEYLQKAHKNFYKKYENKTVQKMDISDFSIAITKNESTENNEISQKFKDFENEKFYSKNHILTDVSIERLYGYLSQNKGVLPEKYQLENGKIVAGSKEYSSPKDFLKSEMNFKKADVEILQKRILELQKKLLNNKDNTMENVNVNIKVNDKDKNKVDYFQIGKEDVAGRFTGIIHDKASENDTARAYVIDDKVVSLEKFQESQKELFESIKQKRNELFEVKQKISYNDKLRMDVANTEVKLTTIGKTYAYSQHNMTQMKPAEMGITKFENGKKLDKNFFQIAKDFVTMKNFRDEFKVAMHEFKQNFKAMLTSKPELAASNIVMAAELQQLKQELANIKTYTQAAELVQKQEQKQIEQKQQAQEQEREDSKIDIKQAVKEVKNAYDEYQEFQDVKSLEKDMENLKENMKESDLEDFQEVSDLVKNATENKIDGNIVKDILQSENAEKVDEMAIAANTMVDNGLKIDGIESVTSMKDIIKSTIEFAKTQNIDFGNVMSDVIKNLQTQQNTKENDNSQDR